MAVRLLRGGGSDGARSISDVDAVLGLIERHHEDEGPIAPVLGHQIAEIHDGAEPQRALSEAGMAKPALRGEFLQAVVVVGRAGIGRATNRVLR